MPLPPPRPPRPPSAFSALAIAVTGSSTASNGAWGVVQDVFWFFVTLFTFGLVRRPPPAPLGTLSYWHQWSGDCGTIGRWGQTTASIPRRIYVIDLSNGTYTRLVAAMQTAVSRWNAALNMPGHMSVHVINTTPTTASIPSAAQIHFVIGTLEQLLAARSRVLPNITAAQINGLDVGFVPGGRVWMGPSNHEGDWIDPNGNRRRGFLMTRAQGYLRAAGWAQSTYDNLATHELGHALGWRGHSNVRWVDIMYRGNLFRHPPNNAISNPSSLSRNEIRHLLQVYCINTRVN